jgi:HSP20 family molecular chaperone IbpA
MTGQDLEVQQKREVQSKEEATVPSRVFLPTTDIFETDQALTVVMEMPGVNKDKVEINLEDGVLTIEGKIDFSKYQDLQPVYTEYNIGNYRRSFTLPETIDQEKIKAEMSDGVLMLSLAKAEKAKPRKIAIG